MSKSVESIIKDIDPIDLDNEIARRKMCPPCLLSTSVEEHRTVDELLQEFEAVP
jgi:hypothetical protein